MQSEKQLPQVEATAMSQRRRLGQWFDRNAGLVFVLPAVLVVLLLSIFPLLVSAYLALSRIRFVSGGFEITFVGLRNFRKLIVGSERRHFLGVAGELGVVGWLLVIAVTALLAYALWRYLRSGNVRAVGVVYRVITFAIIAWGFWFVLRTVVSGGRPGTVGTTLFYVIAGLSIQYLIGLVLALLTTQKLAGRRFFRVVFLLPMMITPVGVGYMFRMITDTSIGPLAPVWQAVGLGAFSPLTNAWGARWAVVITDTWQWTPFVFIILLAAIEGLPTELFEAAHVDGASRLQIFWNITLPQLIPVSATIVLIRLIEAFKIIDLPNILTNGGPGTATESLTLQAFFNWRTLDLGGSAAIAYLLLFIALFVGISYANLIHQRIAR